MILAMSTTNKKDRFARVAEKRTIEVLERLRILGNCANVKYYDYSDADTKQIFAAIEAELKRVKLLFESSKRTKFKLK